MTQATLGKGVHHFTVRLPGEIVRAARLSDGERVQIVAEAGEILLSHVRSLDTMARPVRYAGAAMVASVAQLVRSRTDSLITI